MDAIFLFNKDRKSIHQMKNKEIWEYANQLGIPKAKVIGTGRKGQVKQDDILKYTKIYSNIFEYIII